MRVILNADERELKDFLTKIGADEKVILLGVFIKASENGNFAFEDEEEEEEYEEEESEEEPTDEGE
jgi:hypothetical protein